MRKPHYVHAQHAVDHLADHGFPVQNLEIVGAELRSVERVTGRLTRGKIAVAGALSGLWIGLFVGIAFSLFSDRNQLPFLITTPLLGAAFGLVWSRLGYSTATRRGTRDFASVNQVVATKYEVLVEHTHAARARTPRDHAAGGDGLTPRTAQPLHRNRRSGEQPRPRNSRRRYSMTSNDSATLYTLGDRRHAPARAPCVAATMVS